MAPFSHIHEPGLRLRFAGGWGQYGYRGDRSETGTPAVVSFDVQTYYGEALVGYLERWVPLTAKAFAGVSAIGHAVTPFDIENVVIGDEVGFKGALELWLDIGGSAMPVSIWPGTRPMRRARPARASAPA